MCNISIVQEFTATEEAYYAGSVNWNMLFSSGITQATLNKEQDRVYKLQYRPMFLDKSGKSLSDQKGNKSYDDSVKL